MTSASVGSPATAKPQVSPSAAASPAAPQPTKPQSSTASQDTATPPKGQHAVEKAGGILPQPGITQASSLSSSQAVPKQASGSQEGHVPKTATAARSPAVSAKASPQAQALPLQPPKRIAEASRAAEPDRKVLRPSLKMRPLARALSAMSRPPRKRPRLLANDSGAGPVQEWEAEFLWLSRWMDSHASKYRLHPKAGSPSQTPLPDTQQDSKLGSLDKYLKEQSAAA